MPAPAATPTTSKLLLKVRISRTRVMTAVKSTQAHGTQRVAELLPIAGLVHRPAARSRDLLGVQPKLTQMPPVRFRSAKATVCPALAAVIAAVRPHGPPPATTSSYTSSRAPDHADPGGKWG